MGEARLQTDTQPARKKMTKKGAKRLRRQQLEDEALGVVPVPPAPAAEVEQELPVKLPCKLPARWFVPSLTRDMLFGRESWEPRRSFRARQASQRFTTETRAQLQRLQCPLQWELSAVARSAAELYRRMRRTPANPTPWHVAVNTIHFACEFARLNVMWKSRELLQDVYALLAALPCKAQRVGKAAKVRGKKDRDDLVRKYQAGLKHVLDSCWLLLRTDSDAVAAAPLPDGTAPGDVVPYDLLDDLQKASVWAMRSIMAGGDVHAATKAVELDAGEGQWLLVQGMADRSSREQRGLHFYSPQEQALLRKAYELRSNPETVMALAASYQEGSLKDTKECVRLVEEALEMFPFSSYVHLKSGYIFDKLSRCKAKGEESPGAQRRAKICFSEARRLNQGYWMKACLLDGIYCLANGFYGQDEVVKSLFSSFILPDEDEEEDDDTDDDDCCFCSFFM